MGLFSGSEGRNAAIWNALQAQQTNQQIQSLLNLGQTNAIGALQNAQPQQLAALGQGYQTAQNQFGAASDLYTPYRDTGLSAFQAQADAEGLNGPEGYQRAVARFQTSPGYQFNVDQMIEQTNRGAAAGGQLLSGNTLTALQDRSKGLANQEWGADYARLGGLADRGYAATGAQADIAQGLGKVGYQYGSDLSGVYGGTAQGISNIYGNTARTQAASLGDLGKSLIDSNNQAYQAGQQAKTNTLNFGLGIGSSLASLGGLWLGGPKAPSWARA
jgi:hypothetical protein